MQARSRRIPLAAAAALFACVGCGDDDSVGRLRIVTPAATAAATPMPSPTPSPSPMPLSCTDATVRAGEPLCALDEAAVPCDFLVPEHCLLPYPSSFFLAPDPSTPTGVRVHFARQAMPANQRGTHIDPQEWNGLDGFSPGTEIVALFPEVDLATSNAPTIERIEHSVDDDSPTLIVDAETGERVPHFAELDVQARSAATRVLILRPAVRLAEATRYLVALRRLRNAAGDDLQPGRAFRILRDRLSTPVSAIDARRAALEEVFSALAGHGVERDDLLLAWDFVTASAQALTGRALAVRDQGLAANGPGAPAFTVTSVEDEFNGKLLRRIRGTFTVPLFLTRATPPAMFNLDAGGIPRQNGTATAPFTVTIPRSLVDGADGPRRGRAVVYGHGLLGTGEGEVTAGNLQELQRKYGFVLAATDWIGLSSGDVINTLRITSDLSNFRQLADRLQQAMLNFILLGRLLTAENGFVAHPAFRLGDAALLDTRELFYYGISQGGIEGAAYLALSPDTRRGVLGVGAANYSTLLQRSTDFARFGDVLNQNYTNELDRAVLYPLIQQLWDRGEPNGYTAHLVRDPLPGTPAKKVLLQVGVHDSQVTNIATTIQVRSLGIAAMAPSALPLFRVPEREAPFDDSAFVPYDVGGTPSPLQNVPPAGDNGVHEAVRRLDAAQAQIDAFLRSDGRVENHCGGACVFRDVPDVN